MTPNDKPDDKPALSGFEAFGLQPALLQALTQLGYEEPTPVQSAAIPPLLEGRDVVAQAATGTGKTAAFALPLLEKLKPGACGPFELSALVLVPTRELAIQVAEAIYKYGKALGATVLPVYGGQEMSRQLTQLKRGVDIVVATPGRALDHLRRKSMRLEKVQRVVLDEADEMLDMGFAEDLETLLGALPAGRQTALFSATLPARIASLAERHLRQPVRLKLASEKTTPGEAPRVRQTVYMVPRGGKSEALGRILDLESPAGSIVFCRTRTEVDTLSESLQGHGLRAAALHGGMDQGQRDRVMRRFKSKEIELLVATDVAARGLDIDHLALVVNYDLPTSPEVYVHRIGRTGRAGREGVAITLAESREARLLTTIERTIGQKLERRQLPTMQDVRSRKLQLTRTALRSGIEAGALDDYRALTTELLAEFPAADVAAAAVKLFHEASHPAPSAEEGATERVREGRAGEASADRGERGSRRPVERPRREESHVERPRREESHVERPRREESHVERPRREESHAQRPRREDARSERGAREERRPPARALRDPEPFVKRAEWLARAPGATPEPTPRAPESGAAGTDAAEGTARDVRAPIDARAESPSRAAAAPLRATAADRAERPSPDGGRSAERGVPPRLRTKPDFVQVFVGLGKRAGIRPADLVGALINEAGLERGQVGEVAIEEAHTLVEVPRARAGEVVASLRSMKIRGRPIFARLQGTQAR